MSKELYINDDYNKYNRLVGTIQVVNINDKNYRGLVIAKHPNFDKNLVNGGHYYGTVKYYLKNYEEI